ncbi:MAG: 50S ribosomal protein L29 [Candidatus Caenarcaniphilales bacterium]|nr:50S ribosomal protein L29 [Candidatus Caenarcaniphilales bacterium]
MLLKKKADLKKLSQAELQEELETVTRELDKFYTQSRDKLEKLSDKSKLRHQRARIITFLKSQA